MTKIESGWELNFYCPCKKCCGPNANGTTACGKKVSKNDEYKICAAPKNFKCGTKIAVMAGWKSATVVVQDRRDDTSGKRLDIFVWRHDTALKLGRKKNCMIQYAI